MLLNPLNLTNLNHIASCNCLSGRVVVATHYYDKDLLATIEVVR